MNLEPIIQGEVSKREKNKYRMLTNIYGIYKDDTDEPIFRAAMEMQIQRTDLWLWEVGRKERVGRMKRVAWKHIHYYM